jgi:endogenous inhibitor of DNA gyrase (YacG/DUF329 family)
VVVCPVCGRFFLADLEAPRRDRPFFPFCSERCRALDLGRWIDEDYRISEPLEPPRPEDDRGE